VGEDEFRQQVALKIFDKQKIERTQHSMQQGASPMFGSLAFNVCWTAVEKEINALRACKHPNIVQL
jgi:hypothetical protein